MYEHFNNSAPASRCVKDEEAGIWYGGSGASRDAFAARDCSDQGYFGRWMNSWDYQDCGNWRFRWNCQDARPSNWGPCYRDEESRSRGFRDRADEGNRWCINNGFFGYDGNWRDCGSWYYSHRCGNPEWLGGSWNDDGCQGDGTHRYTRQVNAKSFDWDAAADWLIARMGNPFAPYSINRITKERNNGMWVIVYVNQNDCFIYNQPDVINACDWVNNRQRITKKCNNWPRGWVASNDVVYACTKNAPTGSTVKQFGTEVWAEWYINNNCSYKDGNFVYNEPTRSQCLL